MRKKITRGTPLILHHLKFSKKENENHQFLLCQKENKERKKIIRQAILNIKKTEKTKIITKTTITIHNRSTPNRIFRPSISFMKEK